MSSLERIKLKLNSISKFDLPQEMATTSDSNLIRSLMNLFDCFLDDYNDEKYVASLVNLDIRAQLEVSVDMKYNSTIERLSSKQ